MTLQSYSKVNLRNTVVGIVSAWSEAEAELQNGGQWTETIKGSTKGSLGMQYNSTYDIWQEPQPKDVLGVACSSWTLNTTTGKYSPPITEPALTLANDNDGLHWMWNEAAYQADSGDPKTVGWALTTGTRSS